MTNKPALRVIVNEAAHEIPLNLALKASGLVHLTDCIKNLARNMGDVYQFAIPDPQDPELRIEASNGRVIFITPVETTEDGHWNAVTLEINDDLRQALIKDLSAPEREVDLVRYLVEWFALQCPEDKIDIFNETLQNTAALITSRAEWSGPSSELR